MRLHDALTDIDKAFKRIQDAADALIAAKDLADIDIATAKAELWVHLNSLEARIALLEASHGNQQGNH